MGFQAKHTPLELIDLVREIATAATATAGTQLGSNSSGTLTQAAWNAAREAAGHPTAPAAHAIAQRLQLPWAIVLQIASGSPRAALRALNQRASDKGRKGWSLAEAAYALRQASAALGKQRLNRTDYQRAREQILRGRRGRSARTAATAMPTLAQIDLVLRKEGLRWTDALDAAGLHKAPAPSASRRGVSELKGVRAFVQHTGKLPPSAKQLQLWLRQNEIPARRLVLARFEKAVAKVKAERERDGLPALEVAGRDLRPAAGAGSAGRWTREQILDGLAEAVLLLGGSSQLSQRAVKRLAPAHPQIPTWSSLDRYRRKHHPDQTWDSWRQEAERRARNARRKSGPAAAAP